MTDRPTLIFVYNADGGLFNTMADAAHKIFAPSSYACALCKITHGWISERREWRAFLESLGQDVEIMHRDQFRARFPELDIALPAVLRHHGGLPEVCVAAETLRACVGLQPLIERVRAQCLC